MSYHKCTYVVVVHFVLQLVNIGNEYKAFFGRRLLLLLIIDLFVSPYNTLNEPLCQRPSFGDSVHLVHRQARDHFSETRILLFYCLLSEFWPKFPGMFTMFTLLSCRRDQDVTPPWLFQDVFSAWNRHRCHSLAICRSAARAQSLKVFSLEICVCVCVCGCASETQRRGCWDMK